MNLENDDPYVVYGQKPSVPIHQGLLGKFIFDTLSVRDVQHDAMVDVFNGKTISYERLLQDTCNLAEALRIYGCDSNSIISICSENSLQFFIPLIASLYLGAIVAPISHFYTQDELKHSLSLYQPKIVFCSSQTVQKILYFKPFLKSLELIILMDGEDLTNGLANITGFINKQLSGRYVKPSSFLPFTDADPCENVSFIMSSSGTTGLPKGVMITDRSVLVRITQSREPAYYSPNQDSAVLGLMPFFHTFGLNVTLAAILNKEQVAVFKRFDEDLFLKFLQDHHKTSIAITPALAVFLAKSPKVDQYDLSKLEEILCGAAAMSKELENVLIRRLHIRSIRQAYGLTESNLSVTFNKLNDPNKKLGSVGQVLPYMCLKVRDPKSGKSLGPNQVGEICVKGPLVMKGYFNNPQATKDAFTEDGWLKTGDLGYYDMDKYFYIVDRLKELIKYKGYQVPPAELEAILLNHPKVLDVGVVGAPDELVGEVPVAFVVKKPGSDVSEKELVNHIAKKVSPQKRLRGGVIFVDAIPKNASGKILRRELRNIISKIKIKREAKL